MMEIGSTNDSFSVSDAILQESLKRVAEFLALEESLILHGDPSVPTPQGVICADDPKDDEDAPVIVEG